MQRCTSFLFLSLILCATLSETLGLVFSAREKRGWTLNSAGYLLGPRNLGRLLADENIVRTVIEFLAYLHLKEMGALDKLPSPEETNQS
ncbi:galanin peptides isoform X2 [Aquila chrysaetos chrysaetos]|uniref:galanin peptides isoform X2 n=1 Tax=Aquila chrysaetos chrysaetos TaxID=223781 RepID=UPI001B7D2F66|nr:galanin peptides isoform X2 [Aquila chrysaetos chrysaetos]